MTRRFTTGAAALLAVLLLPTLALAQENGDGPRSTEQLAIDLERSESLYRQAFRAETDQHDLQKAARLYVESAALRPYGDTRAHMALDRAGKLFSHAGKNRQAHRAFAEAGVRALESGDVYGAARAFANAAEASQKDNRDVRLGLGYRQMVYRLSEAPVLTEHQRRDIRQRAGLPGS